MEPTDKRIPTVEQWGSLKDYIDNAGGGGGGVTELTSGTNLYELDAGIYYWDTSIARDMVWAKGLSNNFRVNSLFSACLVLPKREYGNKILVAFAGHLGSGDDVLGINDATIALFEITDSGSLSDMRWSPTQNMLDSRIRKGGMAAPTSDTPGEVGALYAYVENGVGHLAICIEALSTGYTWQILA